MRHVELHNHTHYSLLDGAASPAQYMKRAKELGMDAMAITDHGTTVGWRDFQREAKKAGIKPLLGIEAYITPDRFDRRTKAKRQDGTGIYNHITLIAQNEVGQRNIEQMNSVAWTEGFFHKPRIDIALLKENAEGVIALSGCMSGMIARSWENGFIDDAYSYAQQFKDILGERFFIEVMESNSIELNQFLVSVADAYGIKVVVTSDCHMTSPEDLVLADAMLIKNTNPRKIKEVDYAKMRLMEGMEALNYLYPERQMTFQKFELWLHTYDEHKANLEKHGIGEEAIQNTALVADMVEDYYYHEGLETLPKFPDAEDEVIELRERVYAGLKDKGIDTQANRERIKMELETIEAKNLSGYFLIEADFIDYAEKNDILVGYGRGSAVSYLTNYVLGITGIDPMPYNLLPERFLSLDREDPADVDTDFAIDGRYKVKEYAVRKYGNVSNIATIGFYKDKSALKAAASVFRAPFGETNKLMNRFPTIESFAAAEDTAEYRKKHPHVVPLARKLNGLIQNFGMHAGGIVLSKTPIQQTVPLQTAADPQDEAAGRVPLAGYDMRELADIGFVKYDLLGLRTLSIVDDTLKLIKERHGVEFDIKKDLPLEDKNLYGMISEGRTAGLFQAEAGASTKTILEMGGVSNFLELVASNALVRPGAANSSVGKTYIEGKKTGIIKKLHPDIDEILEETYGAVLYQEQQLLLCEHIAGMSKADANKVRKAISKKIPEDLAKWKDEFIAGATKTLGASKAEKVWKDLEASADYAFAKAHAVGYSMLTLLTAYLKYYYPIEYLVCSLNRMKKDKADRMKTLRYLIEAKRLGIRIRLPHVNASGLDTEIQTDEHGDFIRFGLSRIKFISDKTGQPVLDKGPFESYEAYEKSGIGKRVTGSLNAVGALAFPDNPRTGKENENFFEYLAIPAITTKDIEPRVMAQLRELKYYNEDETFVCMGIVGGDKSKPGWRLIDIVDETAIASAFVPEDSPIEVGEVYVFLISKNSVVKFITVNDLVDGKDTDFSEFLMANGYPELKEGQAKVVSFESWMTKKGQHMAGVVFADENKEMLRGLVWPSDFPKAYTLCTPGAVVNVGFTELDNGDFAVAHISKV